MTEKDTPVLGAHIHHRETGSGDPIVFLHGNPTSSYLWRNVMPRLESEGRCLAPDLIGMGDSGKPDIAYRFSDHARYLDAWFEALGLDGVTLVLHDWGTSLGLHWAKRNAAKVRGIAVMEGVIRNFSWKTFLPNLQPTFRAFRTPGDGEKLILEENVFLEKILPGAILRTLTKEEHDAYRAPYPTPESRKPVLQWPRELPIDGEPSDVDALVRENMTWLSTSDQPKLLLTFEPGLVVDAETVDWARATIRNLEVRAIGPGLHYVQEDHPMAIGDAVLEWRRKVLQGR